MAKTKRIKVKLPEWQQNLHVLWFGNFMAGVGFSMITPFMSLYIDSLGKFSRVQLNLWSGITFSSTFLVTALISPMWGRLADAKGRKLMLMRASLGMAVVIALMGLVTNVYQLVALRFLQGVFSGYISNANALIATEAPIERSGQALGTLTTGNVTGTLLGPLLGGIVATAFGYRFTFFITGSLLFLVFLLTVFKVHEHFTPIARSEQKPIKELFTSLEHPQIIIGMFVTTLIIQASNNSINPVLSLYVRQLMGHSSGSLNIASGIIASIPGIATLIAAPRFGALGDRIGTHKILFFGLLLGLLVYWPQAFVQNIWQLGALRFLVGIVDAALLPQVQTLLAKYAPHEITGRIFSYNQSFQATGNVVGPMLGSFVSGSFGYSGVFISSTLLVMINLIWVRFSTRELTGKKEN
ncbi:multidrug efflux MFS transporter [Lapidilactobacillus mulanensis]|uniref:Multidrug efflux MFS transporter n=1 Tax=Lapidilactobacillus mulanensis TaxID=2485999 RepID=A0ABW4DQA1_9LACO|nr:multidrug efflux MFS transporter [Lapidilactobacillus mulanensis]